MGDSILRAESTPERILALGFCETLTGESQLNVQASENSTATSDDALFTITSNVMNDMRIYGLGLITVLLVMALYGVGWVIKLQIGLLALLCCTWCSSAKREN